MATSYSPKIITDGLVLCLDAADKKSLLAPPTTNLANNSNGTINWTTNSLVGTRTQSTVNADDYHYSHYHSCQSKSFHCPNTTSCLLRLRRRQVHLLLFLVNMM